MFSHANACLLLEFVSSQILAVYDSVKVLYS